MQEQLTISSEAINPPNPNTSRPAPRKSTLSSKGSESELDMLLWRLKARTESTNESGVVFGVTSCCRKSGVSTIAANLAVRASENRMGPVLVIDANLHSPSQHRIFRQTGRMGLLDVLVGAVAPNEAVQPTATEDLDLMALGSTEILSQARLIPENFNEVMRWVREHYSTVFIDFPQIDEMNRALMIARKTDVTIVAVRSESVRRKTVIESIRRFSDDGVNVGGTILTRRKSFTPAWLRPE